MKRLTIALATIALCGFAAVAQACPGGYGEEAKLPPPPGGETS